ncbi:hypothetical protein ACFW6M_00205 [Streptomyces nigra]|uniref:hypothetical protein n=1 Tax=Streptomyces TaxID=1883 RepID=UPI002FDC5C88
MTLPASGDGGEDLGIADETSAFVGTPRVGGEDLLPQLVPRVVDDGAEVTLPLAEPVEMASLQPRPGGHEGDGDHQRHVQISRGVTPAVAERRQKDSDGRDHQRVDQQPTPETARSGDLRW